MAGGIGTHPGGRRAIPRFWSQDRSAWMGQQRTSALPEWGARHPGAASGEVEGL